MAALISFFLIKRGRYFLLKLLWEKRQEKKYLSAQPQMMRKELRLMAMWCIDLTLTTLDYKLTLPLTTKSL